MTPKEQILQNEKKLLEAFKNKDLKILEELLHDDVLLLLPNGITATKTMILDNYRAGDTVMTSIDPDDYIINFIGDNAIVSVHQELKGKYFDHVIAAKFRYMRVWKLFGGEWRVIAGSGIQLLQPG